MRVRIAALLLVVAVALTVVAVVAVRMLAADREALVQRFTDERRHQLQEARAEVEADFAAFSEDLELAHRLWRAADSDDDRARELAAIVAVSREYRQVEVWDSTGVRVSRIAPDGIGTADVPGLDAVIASTVTEARRAAPGQVVVSRPLGGDAGRGLRVFARGGDARQEGTPEQDTIVALVVDTGPVFAKLRILAADPDSRIAVLGAHGVPAPATDPVLAAVIGELEAARGRMPGFASVVDRMRARQQDVVRISSGEARRLGLGSADVIALIQPIRVEDGEPWSMALLSSMAAMRTHERAIQRRMIGVIAVIVLILGGLSGFVLLSARRTVALRERLRHAAELAAVREQAEEQLVRSEKLATVGQLAAGIAHEVGTPLGVARGRAEYMRAKVGGDDPHAGTYDTIMEQIDNVSRTIRALLDFSRLEPAIAATPVDCAALASTVVELLRYEAARGDVGLELGDLTDLPLVRGDRDQLQQVLVNVVMNACDACAKGGTVTVTGERTSAGNAVALRVIDDGAGIAPEDRERVFDPFFTTKKRGKGTGLGLSVVAQIVRNHAGTVAIDSEVGRGTTVTITLPAAVRAAAELASNAG